MEELVFCCPQCLHIAKAGIVTDIATMTRSQHRPVFISCPVCQCLNCILVEDALISTSFDSDGHFIPLDRLHASDDDFESLSDTL
jgi:hypothetical protein